MNIGKVYEKALMTRYKYEKLIEGIEKDIEEMAVALVLDEYKDKIIYSDGFEFELVGVNTHMRYFNRGNLMELVLGYFCKSKLSKYQTKKLEEVKEIYKKYGYMKYCNFKKELWKELTFRVKYENILNRDINLTIQ
jgi:hypothetical protein